MESLDTLPEGSRDDERIQRRPDDREVMIAEAPTDERRVCGGEPGGDGMG